MENLSGLLLTQSKKIATKEWKKQRDKETKKEKKETMF